MSKSILLGVDEIAVRTILAKFTENDRVSRGMSAQKKARAIMQGRAASTVSTSIG